MSDNSQAPIIVKKVKKGGGDGHHGGAWKVAYADFVTAMMAFFLLMWLLNATTESQRKGIADYFNPTIPLSRVSGGGDGSFGGDSVFSEENLANSASGGSKDNASERDTAKGVVGIDRANILETTPQAAAELEADLLGKTGDSIIESLSRKHVATKLTDEGLVVELFDTKEMSLFDGEAPSEMLVELVTVLATIFGELENQVAIEAHVRSEPIVTAKPKIWEESARRADAVRRLFGELELDKSRIARIVGHADREPVAANALSVRNNRIEIILLRDDI